MLFDFDAVAMKICLQLFIISLQREQKVTEEVV
jgi:hypothetical protein